MTRNHLATLLLLLTAAPFAASQDTQSGLVDRAIANERKVIQVVRQRAPVVETYIQNMRPDPVMREVPASDQHFLGRVEFGKVIDVNGYKTPEKKKSLLGHFKSSGDSFLGTTSSGLHLEFSEQGFVQMLLMDSNSFDRNTYQFTFVRQDFLGTVPTAVFDVRPVHKNARGRFLGRIWIETTGGSVVRFNGDFAGGEKNFAEYYHFDSWRTAVQPGLWLPTSFYVDQVDPKSPTSTLKFKSTSDIWGYVLNLPKAAAEQTELTVVGATDVSNDAADLTPLQEQKNFTKQAEDNVIERLFSVGLLDAPSDFDKTLEALVNNILAYNQIAITAPIRVRTLLTQPLESFSVGNTIVLSKSLIDTASVTSASGENQLGNLNVLLAFQLAHILSGHHLDTRFAFTDTLLFADNLAFRRLPMHHSDEENQQAAKRAVELLAAPQLVDSQRFFGLYLQQLLARESGLKALNQPLLGDSLLDPAGQPYLAALLNRGDHLDPKNLDQQAAEPLASFLRFDPWTDQVITLKKVYEPTLSPSDKMPFEVKPIFIKLAPYTDPDAPTN